MIRRCFFRQHPEDFERAYVPEPTEYERMGPGFDVRTSHEVLPEAPMGNGEPQAYSDEIAYG